MKVPQHLKPSVVTSSMIMTPSDADADELQKSTICQNPSSILVSPKLFDKPKMYMENGAESGTKKTISTAQKSAAAAALAGSRKVADGFGGRVSGEQKSCSSSKQNRSIRPSQSSIIGKFIDGGEQYYYSRQQHQRRN